MLKEEKAEVMAVSHDGSLLALGTEKGVIEILDPDTLELDTKICTFQASG
jgi:hypothetical protein